MARGSIKINAEWDSVDSFGIKNWEKAVGLLVNCLDVAVECGWRVDSPVGDFLMDIGAIPMSDYTKDRLQKERDEAQRKLDRIKKILGEK